MIERKAALELGVTMQIKKVVGLVVAAVCVIAGGYLISNGYRSMDKTKEKIRKEVTGNYSHSTRDHVVGGVGLVIVGAVIVVLALRKKW